jgi:transketolase
MQQLERIAGHLRIDILEMLMIAKSGHPGGSLSAIDILTALFFEVLQLGESSNPLTKDRFVLSKGHAVPALYAIFAKKGWIPKDSLTTLRKINSPLQGHPDRARLSIVEASTGSLGQGLSIAQGLAMGINPSRVFCLVGDGEIQEGQIWEALMSAPKFKLSNLIVILDYNQAQIDGPVNMVMPIEPLEDKLKAFGWEVSTVDGHQMEALVKNLKKTTTKPHFIIANTIKGKGVSFMENQIQWHGIAPSQAETEKAIEEIKSRGAL